MTSELKVARPPAKPLMIYDGDCNFCKFWIIRWQRDTAGRVEYAASQSPQIAEQFPELTRERLEQAVQFIETDGRAYSGAEAVFRSLTYTRFWAWTFAVYQDFPGVRPVTEAAYKFIARQREGFSILTRLLWGRDGVLPEYERVRWIFLRCLGIIYLAAFVSLGGQIEGLMGSHGILPVKQFMDGARAQTTQMGLGRYRVLPTLCWLSASDNFLRWLCITGTTLSLLVIFNLAPAICLFLLWLIYLSLTSVGGDFLSFQWDALLLETGWLAIFFAPWQFLPRAKTSAPASRIMLWLLRWLLFRLMYESGKVKLLSRDLNWQAHRALNYHYETQPLPTWIGWWAHQLPSHVQSACVVIMFIIELWVPFLIFAPRRLRFLGCGLLVLLQVCILLTGNYGFFNLLTLALCLLLLDDAFLATFIPRKWRERWWPSQNNIEPSGSTSTREKTLEPMNVPAQPVPRRCLGNWPAWVLAPMAAVILLLTGTQLAVMLGGRGFWSQMVTPLEIWVSPFRSLNTYGLFAVMTTERREIVIEGSNDRQTWLPYEFKYKPGDPHQRPGFIAPFHPRLDWQMWFAALGDYQNNPWLVNCCVRLLEGSPEVIALFGHDPFPGKPPRYVRAMVYDYHFSNLTERRAQGIWWRRELKGEYLPAISLRKDQ